MHDVQRVKVSFPPDRSQQRCIFGIGPAAGKQFVRIDAQNTIPQPFESFDVTAGGLPSPNPASR